MTQHNLTAIACLIDSSGSMSSLTHDTIGSFNTFLAEQKAFPGEALFTLCTFNDKQTYIHDFVKIADVSNLSDKTYVPRNGTALLDAMGHTIDLVGSKLGALPEAERPSKVLFLIITDGQENSSNKFSVAQIKQKVEHQKTKYQWEFQFFGASMDQIADAMNFGIDAGKTLSYSPTKKGVGKLYRSISYNTTSFRSKK